MDKETLKTLYSTNLKAIKKELHLDTTELAKKVEMPSRTIGSYERKENLCSAQLITGLCQNLNINANWFCTGEGEMFLSSPKDNKPENQIDEIMQKVEDLIDKKFKEKGL